MAWQARHAGSADRRRGPDSPQAIGTDNIRPDRSIESRRGPPRGDRVTASAFDASAFLIAADGRHHEVVRA